MALQWTGQVIKVWTIKGIGTRRTVGQREREERKSESHSPYERGSNRRMSSA